MKNITYRLEYNFMHTGWGKIDGIYSNLTEARKEIIFSLKDQGLSRKCEFKKRYRIIKRTEEIIK